MEEERPSWTPPDYRDEPEPDSVGEAATARRWASAYSKLVEFEKSVLLQMQQLRQQAGSELQPMIDLSNIQPMREIIEEFSARQGRWEERARRLEGGRSGGGE